MELKKWVIDNLPNFSSKIKTEEDVKMHIVRPFLEALGYNLQNMRFENGISVQTGTKSITVYSDIEVFENENVELIIDTKAPTVSLGEKDVLQSVSYAKLVSTPPAIFGVVTNGIDVIVTNIYTGRRCGEIPSRTELISEVSRTRKKALTAIEIREVQSLLLTLTNTDELYRIIKKCKDTIEKKGMIRSDMSFKEMTKILLVKMNEEHRAKNGLTNRFQMEILKKMASANKVKVKEQFFSLFQDAIATYPIYSDPDEKIKISDAECVETVIKELEPWSFLGTGDDIKGTVYEIFLKSTLRGDFDQYFTPREIVDFMVKYANPKIGDTILDPACGSGGFLIQSFLYVNQKITDLNISEVESQIKFQDLIDKRLWGGEADEDLHVLAKINLIMHGDGYNNIYQGDSLSSDKIPDEKFNLILTNPPFTIPYTFEKTLRRYEMGIGRQTQELDILFVEKCIKAIDSSLGGEIYIILPEGLLNLPTYLFFREWLLNKCYLTLVVSLPEGAFIPFGKSVSKTTIIGLRKKNSSNTNKPNYVFLANAKEIGYEVGKSVYKQSVKNDLPIFLDGAKHYSSQIQVTNNGGEFCWLEQEKITSYRIDANYLLNSIDTENLHSRFPKLKRLDKICKFAHSSFTPQPEENYRYLEIPDVSPTTGVISNIRIMKGKEIGDSFYVARGGDLAYCRINPRKNRVYLIPEELDKVLISKESYILELLDGSEIKSKYVLAAILQSDLVKSQLVRLATGSSSSRARVQEIDFLNAVFIPIPDNTAQERIENKMKKMYKKYWEVSQAFLKEYVSIQKEFMSDININKLNTI
jgi:type I restriction enzyme M protein